MKILITGCNGQLGNELQNILTDKKAEISTISDDYNDVTVISMDIDELDVTNETMVNEVIVTNRPNIVINCAAYTNVDKCEDEQELAYKLNALAPKYLALACEKIGAKLCHISTDYVFSGEGSTPFLEIDSCNPQSVYGETKLDGERFVEKNCSKYFIIRTAWLYGYVGQNFVKTILRIARTNNSIKVVDDQFGNPTNANDLAYHILKLINTSEFGVYHCTGTGICSWYDFAEKIVEYADIDCHVVPCTTLEFPRPAKRPSYSALDKSNLDRAVGNEMRDWKKALKQYIMTMEEKA